jgi:hypothetical protein
VPSLAKENAHGAREGTTTMQSLSDNLTVIRIDSLIARTIGSLIDVLIGSMIGAVVTESPMATIIDEELNKYLIEIERLIGKDRKEAFGTLSEMVPGMVMHVHQKREVTEAIEEAIEAIEATEEKVATEIPIENHREIEI